MRIRKNHHSKKYKYNVNRKRLNQKKRVVGKMDPTLKKYWENQKLPGKNYYELGLSSDPNKTVPLPNVKQARLQVLAHEAKGEEETSTDIISPLQVSLRTRKRGHVAKELEEQAKLRAPSAFRLPTSFANQLVYFLKQHKLNYKAMVGDKRNFDQWTWKQFRMKIRKLRSIPKQFEEVLTEHKIKLKEVDNWKEYESDSEW